MFPATRENAISYQSYCQLGGCLNSDLTKELRHNGPRHSYFTYHHIAPGQAYWKQDLPAGPSRRKPWPSNGK